MTFNEWLIQFCKREGVTSDTYFDKVDMLDCWNAAREDLLKELYPLRQTNKEQTNENR